MTARGGRFLVAVILVAALALGLAISGCGKNTIRDPRVTGKVTIDDVKLTAGDLGSGWRLDNETTVDPDEAKVDSPLADLAVLGATLVVNQVFARDGERLQVNYVQMKNDGDAELAAEALAEDGTGNLYGTSGSVAIEIIGDKQITAKAAGLLGLSGGPDLTTVDNGRKVEVFFELASVNDIDYMKSNSLSDYLENYQEGRPIDPAMQQVIDSTSFGNAVSLLVKSGSVAASEFSLEPKPTGEQANGGVSTYTFDGGSLKTKAGVPFVSVEGVLSTGSTSLEEGDGTVLGPEQKKKDLEGTAFWPTGDPAVSAALQQAAVPEGASDSEKVEALWRWVRDSIEYGGPIGTRYGTAQVLNQRSGRCWDLSDVFVTMCRAAGVPAREIGGWLADQNSGHIWAQAYLEGKGWVSVDATNDHVGAGSDYLPLYATEDGAMPILYVSMPDVREQ